MKASLKQSLPELVATLAKQAEARGVNPSPGASALGSGVGLSFNSSKERQPSTGPETPTILQQLSAGMLGIFSGQRDGAEKGGDEGTAKRRSAGASPTLGTVPEGESAKPPPDIYSA